jgi:hypothetical protein
VRQWTGGQWTIPIAANTPARREDKKTSASLSLRLLGRMPQPWRLCSMPKVLKHKFAVAWMDIPGK